MTDTTTAAKVPQVKRREDYRAPTHRIETVELWFDLREDVTTVRSRLAVQRDPGSEGPSDVLELHGEQLELRQVRVDGRTWPADRLAADEETLRIEGLPERFVLEVEVGIEPQHNTSLEGLYKAGPHYCTQCEAEGFRKITYFLDRPDVLARYTVTVEAERARYPVLLSNGNCVERGEAQGGRHWARFEDPFPKPSYLFALVAGDLLALEDVFTTRSGREVKLGIYVEPENLDKCEHAMRSLQKSMKWDEDVFGLECDLDEYKIVAVNDFNMGAMENKGLNVFNSKFVLARPETATDADFEGIEGVIAHEYFHNWTGNRVTCRDWFQLSLKEGLTVFRDQQFSGDMGSKAVERISDVRMLRTHQFAEDAGPMAHPVRPESYIEMNNFYSVTVYEKGAEVVRMYHTLLGAEGFRKGMDLYFERHDGEAVTCDDFRAAMADANGRDLAQFEQWYLQAGTPRVDVETRWDAGARRYTLTLAQSVPTAGAARPPLHLPFALGLLGRDGRELPLVLEGEDPAGARTTRVLELTEARQSFVFVGLDEEPVPSLLRGFSAPVKLRYERPREELAFLMAHDPDPFNRWDSGQEYATALLLELVERQRAGRSLAIDRAFVEAFRKTLLDRQLDRALIAEALVLPGEAWLAEQMDVVDPVAIHAARRFARKQIAGAIEDDLRATYDACSDDGPYVFEQAAVGRRSLKNLCLGYLSALETPESLALCEQQFRAAANMTDSIAALSCLSNVPGEARGRALEAFYGRWKGDPLVIDKWFTLQAIADLPDVLAQVEALLEHPDFTLKTPNRVRALVGAFASANPAHFHATDGAGYRFLADRLVELDPINPSIAARLVTPLLRWRRFDAGRQELIRAQLERLMALPKLSKDLYEKVTKSLEAAPVA